MTKKYIWLVLALALFVVPAITNAQDVDTDGGSSCAVLTTNLRYGMRDTNANGNSVSILQDFLNSKGYLSIGSTGFFGSMTRNAVASFQSAYGIQATPPGFVGSITRAKIQEIDCGGISVPLPPPIPVPVPVVPPKPSAPVIRIIESKANPVDTITTGEKAFIHGTNLGGKVSATVGGIPVSIQSNSDTYAEFYVPYMPTGYKTVLLSNAAGNSNSYGVTVTSPTKTTLEITTYSPLSKAKVGEYYSLPLSASGGDGDYSWGVSSGALPNGLLLNRDYITGKPETSGTYTFEVQVISRGAVAYKKLTLTVVEGDFSTKPSTITIIYPNGGETWSKGSLQNINWSHTSCAPGYCGDREPGYYDITLNKVCAGWVCTQEYRAPYVLTQRTGGTSFNWEVGNAKADDVPPDTYKVQVCESGTSICDQSDSYFKIIDSGVDVKSSSLIEKETQTAKVLQSLRSLLEELSRQIQQ